MSFWIGFIVGSIGSPLFLAAISRPLMKWIVKRKMSNLAQDIMGKLGNLGNSYSELNEEKEENNVTKEKEKS